MVQAGELTPLNSRSKCFTVTLSEYSAGRLANDPAPCLPQVGQHPIISSCLPQGVAKRSIQPRKEGGWLGGMAALLEREGECGA